MSLLVVLLWIRTWIPGAAMGLWLKLKWPWNYHAQAINFGLSQDPPNKLSVMAACGTSGSHRSREKCLSILQSEDDNELILESANGTLGSI